MKNNKDHMWAIAFANYRKTKNNVCPFCAKNTVEYKIHIIKDGVGYATAKCSTCGENFIFSRIEEHDGKR